MTTTTTTTATIEQATCSIEVPAIVWDELFPLFVGQHRYGDRELIEVRETAADTFYRIHMTDEQVWLLAVELVELAGEANVAADEEPDDADLVALATALRRVIDSLRAECMPNEDYITTLN